MIWFEGGTEDENAERAARIAREIRIALMTEFTDAVLASVASTTTTAAPGTNEVALRRQIDERLDTEVASGRQIAQAKAQSCLAQLERASLAATERLYGRGGQPLPAVYCTLPEAATAQLSMSLTQLSDLTAASPEIDLAKLRCTTAFIQQAVEKGVRQAAFVAIRSDLLLIRSTAKLSSNTWRAIARCSLRT
jgi:hypothetical protein